MRSPRKVKFGRIPFHRKLKYFDLHSIILLLFLLCISMHIFILKMHTFNTSNKALHD